MVVFEGEVEQGSEAAGDEMTGGSDGERMGYYYRSHVPCQG